jgi:hypothetical protein
MLESSESNVGALWPLWESRLCRILESQCIDGDSDLKWLSDLQCFLLAEQRPAGGPQRACLLQARSPSCCHLSPDGCAKGTVFGGQRQVLLGQV